jgi:hypothetical protein
MKTLGKAILFVALALPPLCWGQATKVTIQEPGSDKVQRIDKQVWIGCTNGGNLHLMGEIRVAVAAPTCKDASCKEIDSDKLASGVHVPPGQAVGAYCKTKAEDELSDRDAELCKNTASNPRPQSQAEWEKWNAEYGQCLKDRAESRRKK